MSGSGVTQRAKVSSKAQFWRLFEIEFIQSDQSIAAMADKFGISRATAYRQVKTRDLWARRKEYTDRLSQAQAVSKAANKQEVFSSFVESAVHQMAYRLTRVLERERVELEGKAGEPGARVDTPAEIAQRAQAIAQLAHLGKIIYPSLGPEQPDETDYRVHITTQQVKYVEGKPIAEASKTEVVVELPHGAKVGEFQNWGDVQLDG